MKYLILGGGISGLSAAWFLKRKHPDAQITLLEKENRLGGWIQTSRDNGYLFEKGPRTFQVSRSPHLLNLIRELGLESELIYSAPARRYLLHRGRLRSIVSFLPMLIPSLLKQPFLRAGIGDDESIYDFASRRFSPKIAETLFDPLTLGIYAGDIRKLSIRSCFTKLYEWDRKKSRLSFPQGKGLFTLRGGMGRLIEELQKQLKIDIVLNHPINSQQEIIALTKTHRVYSALPAPVIGSFFNESFPTQSLSIVQLVYPGQILPKSGFGYLVPSQEQESLLGMIWDSSVFPQQNTHGETRLTAMIRSPSPLAAAIDAAERHLGIRQKPVHSSTYFAKDAIPQFEVGYWKKIALFEKRAKELNLTLLGNYFEGASVEACVARSALIISSSSVSEI